MPCRAEVPVLTAPLYIEHLTEGRPKNKLWEATLSATAHCRTFVADRVASHKKTGSYLSADPNRPYLPLRRARSA